jgi:hypothetical protein
MADIITEVTTELGEPTPEATLNILDLFFLMYFLDEINI